MLAIVKYPQKKFVVWFVRTMEKVENLSAMGYQGECDRYLSPIVF
jgi:hypothetical protein